MLLTTVCCSTKRPVLGEGVYQQNVRVIKMEEECQSLPKVGCGAETHYRLNMFDIPPLLK